MEVSRVEVVVLGLLAEEPMYGYELLERFRDRGMSSWAEVGKASVYQALRRLEAEKLVSGRAQAGEGPERRVYRISRIGRDRLRRGLLERFATGEAYEIESNVSLGFAHLLSVDQLRKGIAARKAQISALQDRIKQVRSAGSVHPLTGRMLDLQDALAKAELAWLTAFGRDAGKLRR